MWTTHNIALRSSAFCSVLPERCPGSSTTSMTQGALFEVSCACKLQSFTSVYVIQSACRGVVGH